MHGWCSSICQGYQTRRRLLCCKSELYMICTRPYNRAAVKRIRRSSPWFDPTPRILCLTCMLFIMPIRPPAHPMIDALPLAIAFCLVPICLVLPIRKSLPWLGQVLRQNSLAMAASEVTWWKALLTFNWLSFRFHCFFVNEIDSEIHAFILFLFQMIASD